MAITEKKIFFSHELSNEAYHADAAIGSSGIKKFSECPAIYHAHYLAEERKEFKESAAQRIGSFAHIKLLEPDRFKEKYAVAPEFATLRGGKNKGEKVPMNKTHKCFEEFETGAIVIGKEAILHSEFKQAQAMSKAIAEHPLASKMLVGGKEEMSFFAKCPDTGLMIKSRPDYLRKLPDLGVILIDYKTTALSLSTTKQSNHAFSLGRQIQAAHHKRVAELATEGEINEVVYITQMQEAPYLVRIFRMPYEAIQIGEDMVKQYLQGIAECHAKNEWPGYPEEIEDYTIPAWLSYEFN